MATGEVANHMPPEQARHSLAMDSAKRMAASNAIVSIVGMYAGMLAEAEHEAERNGRAVAELADQIGDITARSESELGLMRASRDLWEDKARQHESAAAEILRLQEVCDVRAREIVRLNDAINLALSYGEVSRGLKVLKEVVEKANVE